MGFSSILALVALGASTSAHTIFQEVYINGADQGHQNGIRVPSYDGPITDVTSNDLICNGGINPYVQPVSSVIIPAKAGDTVTAEWHHTLAGADPSDPADPIDPGHKGPVIAYLAKVPNALQTDVTGLSWFKIWEDGMSADGSWGVDRLVAAKGKVSFPIPACIEAGEYLLRVEIIALHGASTYPGAQFYMECAQMSISGGGSTQPATVSFPGAYHSTDPGVTINIYYPVPKNYTVPGPDVFSCSGSSKPASPTTVAPSTSTVKVATTVAAASTAVASPGSGATAAHYAQCGGTGFTGPTTCASPFTCTKSSEYYSQCL
ncbi:carbohydrate-binding module family 1 protein [Peniophora sp. CONT]|nr:carbohydrate-binding module family 1 protein [Peniophora sp. CONT]